MSAAAVHIRKMTPADVRAILAIDEKIVGEHRSASWQQRIDRYLEIYYPPVCQVAEVGGRVVGFILGDVRGWEYGLRAGGWIDIMGVDPEYQKQGIGRMLVTAFVEQCHQEGIKAVHVMVRAEDNPMQSFFRSVGFQRGRLMEMEKAEG
jgi:ribosomal protein S18 acetylase RimI-like enzyme